MSRGRVTISTTNGSKVSQPHNIRDPEIVRHEPHIDPNGIHEIWQHETVSDFYERELQPFADGYDEVARASRRVGNYLDKLTQEAIEGEAANEEIRQHNLEHKAKGEKPERLRPVKKPCYEMIVGIYPQGDLELSEREQRELLYLWFFGDGTPDHPGWKERNPNMCVVGAYYHADEPEAEPHLHIDYVPVGNFNRGMRRQNSLERALTQQGMKSGKVAGSDGNLVLMTAQEQFQEAENSHLQTICEEASLDVIHPQRGKRSRHLSTAEKKIQTRLNQAVARLDRLDREAAERERRSQEAAAEAAAAILRNAEQKAGEIIAEADRKASTRLQERESAILEREQRIAKVQRRVAATVASWRESGLLGPGDTPKTRDQLKQEFLQEQKAQQQSAPKKSRGYEFDF